MNSNLLSLDGVRSLKSWARVPDERIRYHPYEVDDCSVWCPVVKKDTVRTDIRLAKREGIDPVKDFGRIGRFDSGMVGVANEYDSEADWILHLGDEVLMVGNDRDLLRDTFNHQMRWQFVRPPALTLTPGDDDIEEILSAVVKIKEAEPGDMVLRYHSGPVLDVAIISHVNRSRTKFNIVGDTISLTANDFVPPTKYRKEQYREGIQKLRAPVVSSRSNSGGEMVYPEQDSVCIPGRSGLKLRRIPGRKTDSYLRFDFEIENHGAETVNWLHYQWARETFAPKECCPFAYQGEHRLNVLSVTNHGAVRVLYPGSKERISVCVGQHSGREEPSVFIPAYFFGGFEGCYFKMTATCQ